MPLIASFNSDATEGKMLTTQNGISLFTVGPFFTASGTGYTVANSVVESSIVFAASAATTVASIPTPSAAWTAVNMSSDPTGKSPASSLYLPGSAPINVPTAPLGSLNQGSVISGAFMGVAGITSTPTMEVKIYLRSATTGAVSYTLLDTTTGWSIAAGGFILWPEISVLAGGAKGSIAAAIAVNNATIIYVPTPTVTTVDCTQSYILDMTFTWSAANSSNTFTMYSGFLEYTS